MPFWAFKRGYDIANLSSYTYLKTVAVLIMNILLQHNYSKLYFARM